MNTIFVHRDGRTEPATSIERSWLSPAAGVYLWVDLASPSIPESLVLSDTFAFHRLAVDDALLPRQLPKIEAYDGYLFAGMAAADADIGLFVGPYFVVSVRSGDSHAVSTLIDSVRHGGKQFLEGPVAMFHRLLDGVIKGLTPELEKLAQRAGGAETRLLGKPNADALKYVLDARAAIFDFNQRQRRQLRAVGRFMRGEVVDISAEMAFRFRDAHSQLLRLTDEATAIGHRLDGVTAAGGLAGRKSWI